jgi:ParB-like chromosome segregation protein Spo0J
MEAPNPIPNEIFLAEIDDSGRQRQDYGDLGPLQFSIREFGLIHPLVVTWDDNRWKLLVGGRRLKALQKMGRDKLIHGKEILVREELYNSEDKEVGYLREAIELEENIRRKDITWPEQIKAKERLFKLHSELYGVRGMGGATRAEKAGASVDETGVSVRKLAAILGESPATVSQDLQLASAMKVVPQLAMMENKSTAAARVKTLWAMIQAKTSGQPMPQPKAMPAVSYRVLVFVADEAAQIALVKEMEARGLRADPIIV